MRPHASASKSRKLFSGLIGPLAPEQLGRGSPCVWLNDGRVCRGLLDNVHLEHAIYPSVPGVQFNFTDSIDPPPASPSEPCLLLSRQLCTAGVFVLLSHTSGAAERPHMLPAARHICS